MLLMVFFIDNYQIDEQSKLITSENSKKLIELCEITYGPESNNLNHRNCN